MKGRTAQELKVGDVGTFAKTVSEADVYNFAGVSGDFNPAHINEEYAKDTFFKGRIAHGMLSAGFISTTIALHMPGPGTIYLTQELKFTKPVRIGDTITATVTVAEIDAEKNRVKLDTVCTNQDGETVISGSALVMPPK